MLSALGAAAARTPSCIHCAHRSNALVMFQFGMRAAARGIAKSAMKTQTTPRQHHAMRTVLCATRVRRPRAAACHRCLSTQVQPSQSLAEPANETAAGVANNDAGTASESAGVRGQEARSPTVAEFYRDVYYHKRQHRVSANTWKREKSYWNSILAEFGDTPLNQLSGVAWDDYLDTLNSGATKRLHQTAYRALLKMAVHRGFVCNFSCSHVMLSQCNCATSLLCCS